MSPEVAANSESCAIDTQAVQRPKRRNKEDKEEKAKKIRTEKKQESFRVGVVASLAAISVAQVQDLLGKEEDKLREFKLALLKSTVTRDERSLHGLLIDHSVRKTKKCEEEIGEMRCGSAAIMCSCTDGMA